MSQFWKVDDSVRVGERKISIPSENGLSYSPGQKVQRMVGKLILISMLNLNSRAVELPPVSSWTNARVLLFAIFVFTMVLVVIFWKRFRIMPLMFR